MTAIPVLRDRRVAITRPEAGELEARLAALGATVIHAPLIEVADAADSGGALRAALARLGEFDWLVVTSANGAERVGRAAAEVATVRLAAVGPATATALAEAAGRPADLVPAVATAEGLLAELANVAPSKILLAQADRARPVLADGLAAAGHRVESVVAYRTVEVTPSPAALAELRTADAVVLASGSAARAYARAMATGPEGSVRPIVVCIGPVTAAAARHAGLPVTHVAPHPDPTTLTELVTTALTSP
ncbi:MAG: uroporphyrinogen-III synthase [Ilumatobacteraceae bacterium]